MCTAAFTAAQRMMAWWNVDQLLTSAAHGVGDVRWAPSDVAGYREPGPGPHLLGTDQAQPAGSQLTSSDP